MCSIWHFHVPILHVVSHQFIKQPNSNNGSLVSLAKFPFVYCIFVPPEDGRRLKHVVVVIIKN
jgi:hypothetical protein